MRYITHRDTLVLFEKRGKPRHTFGPFGVLIVGDNSCTVAGYRIDAELRPSAPTTELMPMFPNDLAGAQASCPEVCGLGTLTTTRVGGAATASLAVGRRGLFFEAPVIATTTNLPNVAGIYYEVLSGTAIYNSVTYTKGEQFVSEGGGVIAVTGSGTYALCIPPALAKKADEFLAENFKIKHLKLGDESSSYFDWNAGGFEPRDSQDSPDTDFFGWIVS